MGFWNTTLIIVLTLIALTFFLYLFFNITPYDIQHFVKGWWGKIKVNIPKEEAKEALLCKELALELIPDNFTLRHAGVCMSSSELSWTFSCYEDFYWNDGSEMLLSGSAWGLCSSSGFAQGSKEGQNINYYYSCQDSFGSAPSSLKYAKKIISEEGIVLGERAFVISPTLKAIPNTTREDYGWANKMDFEIVDYNFVSCRWVFENGTILE